MTKALKTINIAELVVESYDTEDVVAFLCERLKRYNTGDKQDAELGLYVSILSELNDKLGGSKSIKVIV